MDPLTATLCLPAGLLLGLVSGYLMTRSAGKANLDEVRRQSDEIVRAARDEADGLKKQAELKGREDLLHQRDGLTREMELVRAELREQERRLDKREDGLDEKTQLLAKKERQLESAKAKLIERKGELERLGTQAAALVEQQTAELNRLSGLSRDQAEALLLSRLEKSLADAVASRLHRFDETLKATAEERARRVIATAIHRYAAEHTADTTVSTVDIPSDDMKGRIIGREGRNIRTFEKATGVDVIVDDTPGVVVVSAFDNVRRETARIALTKLIQDGRIHPSRIEEVVLETQAEMEKHIQELGRLAVEEANIGPLHEKLQQLLGRLKFRTSYSQNVLHHSIEVAYLCGMMADELGLDGKLARRCGLLHDIGKAADHEMEGGHPKIGADLAARYGEKHPDVLHAILGHHDDVTIDHIYTVLVASADAISASRPGARRETLEKYVKRLEELEAVASGFPGVEHAYAIQAGREVRVIANASRTTDADAMKVCHDIARAIEEQLHYPGEIKVTVIRETRAVEIAK
ncbi:MAG: ribonuclease Y [Gemmataceae bacterium]